MRACLMIVTLDTLILDLPLRGHMLLYPLTRCECRNHGLPCSADIGAGFFCLLVGAGTGSTGRATHPSKRVILLGPSHHVYIKGVALSPFASYGTPIGDIPLDLDGEAC